MPEVVPPVLGRPSPASLAPARLARCGEASGAAYRADAGESGPWSLRAATVTGVRHRLAGQGCEDAYAWSQSSGLLVVAVADGVGSSVGAAGAARAAVTAACGVLADTAAGKVGAGERGGSEGGSACLEAVIAANSAVSVSGGATTLVVAAATDGGVCHLARIGDSTALVLVAGEWRELFGLGPGPDELATTATAALPAEAPLPELATWCPAPGEALVMVTDGVANPLRDGPSTVAPVLAAALGEPPPALGLAALIDFSRQGCFDDRTLLGLWRRLPDGEEAPSGR